MKPLAAAMISASIAASCAQVGAGTDELNYECPDGDLITVSAITGSASEASDEIHEARIASVRGGLEEAADCGGRALVLYLEGEARVEVLFDEHLETAGGTETSRDKKIPRLVDGRIKTIAEDLDTLLSAEPAEVSDPLGTYAVLRDYAVQLDDESVFHVRLLTDGVVHTPELDLNRPLTEEEARQLAAEVAVTGELGGMTITIIGLGITADTATPPSSWVSTLRTFHQLVCERTNATCTAVTQGA